MRRTEASTKGGALSAPSSQPLIVQSHLRWDFVWQRPQQILSRLAEHSPVLFVEEPLFLDDIPSPKLEITVPYANVFRAVPHLPSRLRDDSERGIADIRNLVQEAISPEGHLKRLFKNPVQWFYSPFTAPAMLGAFNEVAVVYDCMDELAQFRFAHPDLARRERLLLAQADVVFTGGFKLYESQKSYHNKEHFFGCGVDVWDFGKGMLAAAPGPPRLHPHKKPRVGEFGGVGEGGAYDLI